MQFLAIPFNEPNTMNQVSNLNLRFYQVANVYIQSSRCGKVRRRQGHHCRSFRQAHKALWISAQMVDPGCLRCKCIRPHQWARASSCLPRWLPWSGTVIVPLPFPPLSPPHPHCLSQNQRQPSKGKSDVLSDGRRHVVHVSLREKSWEPCCIQVQGANMLYPTSFEIGVETGKHILAVTTQHYTHTLSHY